MIKVSRLDRGSGLLQAALGLKGAYLSCRATSHGLNYAVLLLGHDTLGVGQVDLFSLWLLLLEHTGAALT